MRYLYCFQAKDSLFNAFFQSSNNLFSFINLFLVFVDFTNNFERSVIGSVFRFNNGFSHQLISQIFSLAFLFLLKFQRRKRSVLVKRVLFDLLDIKSFIRVILHQVFYHTLAVFRYLNLRPIRFVGAFLELFLSYFSKIS